MASRFDEAGSRLNKEIGLPTKEENAAIAARRRRDQAMGKIYRTAARGGDLGTLVNLERAGHTNYGIENVDDKNKRYGEEVHQRGFQGAAAVGGQQGAGVASNPASGQPPINNQPLSARLSFDEQDRIARGKSEVSGAFGEKDQVREQAKQLPGSRRGFVDKVSELRGKEGGLTDSEGGFAQAKGKELGLNDNQIYDTLDGQDDLSPTAVTKRAEGRKDKKRADEITSGLLGETEKIPSPMDVNSPFRLNKTGFEYEGVAGPAIKNEAQAPPSEKIDDFAKLTEPTKPVIDSRGMLSARQPILDEGALRSDKKERTLSSDLSAIIKGGYDSTIGAYQRYNKENNAEADRSKKEGEFREDDSLIKVINYTHGNTGDKRIPTSSDIDDYAARNKVSRKEARDVLRKKSAEARGEKFTPQASINLEKPSKEFRSAYDSLRALEQFTV